MASNTNKDYTQMHIKASDHPKAYAPHILILNIVMSILGAIIGLELIVRTGVAPNTSIVGMLIGFPSLPLGILVAYTSATGPAFSDMAYDLKCGYILRGCGQDQELELEGRKQQYISEIIGFIVAFILVAIMAKQYFSQGLFAPVDATFAATIEAGAGGDVAKWLLIWAIPGAIIQFLGGSRQVGILFATGLLVGSTINGLTILIALLIRYILVKKNKENEQTLNILGAGSLAGAALYSFFTATLSLGKKK